METVFHILGWSTVMLGLFVIVALWLVRLDELHAGKRRPVTPYTVE